MKDCLYSRRSIWLYLFSSVILTVLICGLLILGGSYALPIQAEEVISSNTIGNTTDTSLYYDKDSRTISLLWEEK